MDTANAELSKSLNEVLDCIGASEYERRRYWEVGMLTEIVSTALLKYYPVSINRTIYHVGSTCEGTTTPGMNSDFDTIFCGEDMHVIENIVDAKQQGISHLIITDEFTKPGYVRLQIVKDKCPLGKCNISENSKLTIDHEGNMCLPHREPSDGISNIRNGPADTILATKDTYQHDIVYALRYQHIPRLHDSWLDRKRKYGWPSQKQLKAMGALGCFFVGVGHSHSINESCEWRMSYTLQERDLMLNLNETQHKCYILLKIIKEDIIVAKINDESISSISSYHCKTSLFYAIENSQRHMWVDSNLLHCLQLCLKFMLKWVEDGYCPNYFIPEENMFDKLNRTALNTIKNILIDIIKSGANFLNKLTCDNVGAILQSKMCGSELLHSLAYQKKSSPRLLVCQFITKMVFTNRNLYLRQLMNDSKTDYMHKVMQMLIYLNYTNHVTEHTTSDVRMALDNIIPHIQLQYEQCVLARYSSGGDLSHLKFKTFQSVISESSSGFQPISSKLALASLYIQLKQLQEECLCILLSCENSLEPCGEPNIVSECGCHHTQGYSDPALSVKFRFTEMSSQYYQRHCITGCMIFHPSQVALLHKALQYELFHTVYTEPVSEIRTYNFNRLNYWVTIDSKIYLYFLQYLLYSNTQQIAEQETAVRKLVQVLETDPNLGHIETAYNMLGWICLQENDIRAAWKMFCRSWKFRPFINAAKWHMLICLKEIEHRATTMETNLIIKLKLMTINVLGHHDGDLK